MELKGLFVHSWGLGGFGEPSPRQRYVQVTTRFRLPFGRLMAGDQNILCERIVFVLMLLIRFRIMETLSFA
jgi:hypothetical protein